MSGRILYVTRRVGLVAAHILVYALIWLGLAALIAAVGIRFFWGEISVGQMLMNLVSVETDGGGGAIVWIGILGIGVVPLLITVAIALWRSSRRRRRLRNGNPDSRGTQPFMRPLSTLLVAAVVLAGTTAFATTVGLGDYIKAANSKYDVGDYYVEPTVTSADQKRNLVVIYLESGEATLEDDQLFEKDAFAPLKEATKAEEGWQTVADFQQYEGGGWTMAGLASTQCGIPLKGNGAGGGSATDNGIDEGAETYLGGATCVGDVLDEQGYTNVFLGGANPSFAAKDTFLYSHGYSAVKGLSDWRAAGEPEENFRKDWGLSDQRLMAHARDTLDDLHAEAEKTGRPFNLTMLTLDTHEPVHIYDYCDVDTDSEVTSVFSCSMTQVASFIGYMKEQGYLDDTAVVIMGDHLKHMSAGDAFHEQLDDHENRTIFNRIWVPGETPANSTLRAGSDQLNMYPTILEAAGLTLEGGEAGLGVSAFASEVPGSSAQAMDQEAYTELLGSLSPRFYAKAWAGAGTQQ
ncbi:LTA synthase family protein [Arthrobacter sp. zg-Y40]|uniref:LTA synthase family protein n=1 Tax=Arthrobacter sp. zg-Y40 TaxID=2886939 RepID=UPI001D1421A6|nr:LTA synthase family protein [Arthrobacter sp. zg-Y40]MCC3280724.1 LTA synthase family protein [Arthrobacter sp. zg-Y40]